MISALARRHPLLSIHLVIVCLLLVGLVQRSGLHHIGAMAGYVAVLLCTYALLDRALSGRVLRDRRSNNVKPLAWAVLAATCVVAIAHWTILGHVPLIAALGQCDDLAVQSIRLHMTLDIPDWLNYAGNFLIKAFIPVALILCYRQHPRLFTALAIVGGIYAVSLIQKSYIITLFVPLWVLFLLRRRWKSFALLTGGFVVVTAMLFLVAQPEKLAWLRGDRCMGQDKAVQEEGLAGNLLYSVVRRVVLMPGWTVSAWFENIPAKIPFQHGAAVRPLAIAMGKPYHALDRKVYDIEYPKEAAEHTQGTMGSASFMYGWANFGLAGLLLSGVITALVLRLFTLLFPYDWRWAACLNVFPLLVLSSAALSTVLVTHGWAITLALAYFFKPSDRIWQ